MRIAYFDCISGISGNMALGAMLDCGLNIDYLRAELAKLPIGEWTLTATQVQKLGIAATHVDVDDHPHQHEHGHGHHHPHRNLADILAIINAADLAYGVREKATAVFTRLAEAEAQVHGSTIEEVHFHEVGAIDAIIDIVGFCIGIEELGIERIISSPLPLGNGWVKCAHGVFPVPAPATALLTAGFPIATTDIEAELVTPTGAALITTLAESFGPLPAMVLKQVGYGAGTKELPRPNVLRLFLGETAYASEAPEEIIGLEVNLDDTTGETLGYAMDRLFAVGALDVFFTAIQMKKNRHGILLQVLCTPDLEDACTNIIFRETTTLGVRRTCYTRTVLPRRHVSVPTIWGEVRMKVSCWNGIERAAPEYEDCRQLAEEHNIPLQQIYIAAHLNYREGE